MESSRKRLGEDEVKRVLRQILNVELPSSKSPDYCRLYWRNYRMAEKLVKLGCVDIEKLVCELHEKVKAVQRC